MNGKTAAILGVGPGLGAAVARPLAPAGSAGARPMNCRTAAMRGVGPGLGAAVARRFAREGFAVALMARREGSVAGVREEIEGAGGTAGRASPAPPNPRRVAARAA